MDKQGVKEQLTLTLDKGILFMHTTSTARSSIQDSCFFERVEYLRADAFDFSKVIPRGVRPASDDSECNGFADTRELAKSSQIS